MAAGTDDYRGVALAFVNALASRNYALAYEMTSKDYRQGTTLDALRDAFETIVPTEWGSIGAIDVGHTMDDWPGKQASDAGWVYVSVGGDVYSEAVVAIVAREDAVLKVRAAEFGRP